jgi:phosphoglycerol transferase MdoB-like AlkP superfamily enzyme
LDNDSTNALTTFVSETDGTTVYGQVFGLFLLIFFVKEMDVLIISLLITDTIQGACWSTSLPEFIQEPFLETVMVCLCIVLFFISFSFALRVIKNINIKAANLIAHKHDRIIFFQI